MQEKKKIDELYFTPPENNNPDLPGFVLADF